MSEPASRVPSDRLGVDQRAAALDVLRTRTLDVLVIGGGVVGAGAALDAASRGLEVGIIEAQDWASGTSSRSSKLVHGGIRYLEQLDFKLVREALIERGLLLRTIAPHLVTPVPFLYPVTHPLVERLYVGAGMLLYDLLSYSGGRHPGVGPHRHFTRGQLRQRMPGLNPSASRGGLRYFDAQVDDARLVATIIRTAVGRGASAASRVSAVQLMPTDAAMHSVIARDEETGEQFEIRARSIVNATGVWTEETQALLGELGGLGVTMSKGVHIVVARDRFESELGLVVRAGASVLFVIPWGEFWLIGTTDTPWHLDRANPAATAGDIDYLLGQVNRVLATPITRDDIRGVYAGLRPLVARRAAPTTKLSREHAVDVPREGIAVIAGGKLTTYRIMARDAVDAAIRGRVSAPRSETARIPLVGAASLEAARSSAVELVRSLGLPDALADRLLGRYGDRVADVLERVRKDATLGQPIAGGCGAIRAEALYAVTHEGALHLVDVLERRLRISMESADFGVEAAPEVAAIMGASLGWSAARTREELANHRVAVEHLRAAMALPDDESANAVLAALA